MAGPERTVVVVGSRRELPEALEPGVYYVGGVRVAVRERVPRDAVRRALAFMKRRGGRYV